MNTYHKLIAATFIFVGEMVSYADAPRLHLKSLSERRIENKAKGLSCPTGGPIMRKYSGSYISIVNNQTSYSMEEVEKCINEIRKILHFPIFKSSECHGKMIGVEIELVDIVEGKTANALFAPEDGWAKVGVKRLVEDNPNPNWKARRLKLTLLRAVGTAMGVGYSMYQPCVMCKVRTIADLDDIKVDNLGPEGENNLEECAKQFGVGKIEYCSYRTACQEGWAPAPTNDVQKAIWEKVHAIPDKPLKIEYDPKKDK